MEIKLPLGKPLINFLAIDNHISAIINSNPNKYKNYLYYNFTEIDCSDRFVQYRYSLSWRDFQCFHFYNIPRNEFEKEDVTLKKVVEYIENGLYLIIDIDTEYINNYKKMESHQPHEIMIIGYNDTEHYFLCADFFDKYYTVQKCDEKQIINSIIKFPVEKKRRRFYNCILIERFQGAFQIDLDINRFVNSLNTLLTKNNINLGRIYSLDFIEKIKENILNERFDENFYYFKMNSYFFLSQLNVFKLFCLDFQTNMNILNLREIMKEIERAENIMTVYKNKVLKKMMNGTKLLNDDAKIDLVNNMDAFKNTYMEIIKNIISILS